MSATFAVIGAGIAGLSCAQRLQAAGLAVEVFEKSRRPGGRSTTRRGDGWQADHGAQYFTARDAGFRAAVEDWLAAGVVAPWLARIVSFDANGCWRPISGSEPRFVGTPGMSAISRHLSEGLVVHYDTRVDTVRRDADGWLLDTAQAGLPQQRYASLVVALPSPQAATLLHDVAPALAGQASACAMRGCHALIARYASGLTLPFDGAFINNGGLSWVACDTSKPGRPAGHTWVLHAPTPEDVGFDASPETVIETMLDAFTRIGARRPDALTLHHWRFAQNASDCATGSLWAEDLRLGLAGDWLHGGRIEGAWLSGQHLAESVIAAQTGGGQRSNSTP